MLRQDFSSKKLNQTKSEIILKDQSNEDNLNFIDKKIKSQLQIKKKPIDEQIKNLIVEIKKIDEKVDEISKEQKKYTSSRLKVELMSALEESKLGKSMIIPEVSQRIEKDNPDLMLYVLKEVLARDQNRELLLTEQQYSFGFDPIVGVFSQDYECIKFTTQEVQFDQLQQNDMFRKEYLTKFQETVSKSYNIMSSEVEILDIKSGSSIILFHIKSKKDLENNEKSHKFLEENLNGQVELYNYFVDAKQKGKLKFGLSLNDFDKQFNMNWNNFHQSEKRGPPYHRYNYYFPIGCQGYGINISKYGENQDWLKMNGNDGEWRIVFHGTKNNSINDIIKTNLKPGERNLHSNDDCIDEFGRIVKVGNGIYFSDQFDICIKDGYATPLQIQDKKFCAIFMTRVNPKKIRQSDEMKNKQYFVINNSEDVRPYRLLIYEVK